MDLHADPVEWGLGQFFSNPAERVLYGGGMLILKKIKISRNCMKYSDLQSNVIFHRSEIESQFKNCFVSNAM